MRRPIPTTSTALTAAALVLSASAAMIAIGGPLDPPAGAVGPTYKTLSEIEPRILVSASTTPGDADSVYRITQPGSYYLGANLSVPNGYSGIEVAASGVTIDLCGFQIIGLIGSRDGITTQTMTFTGVNVRNGTIASMGNDGISLFAVDGGTIENVTVRNASNRGIYVQTGGIARDCTATGCGIAGFAVSVGATLEQCAALDNVGPGFISNFGATLIACSARDNQQAGFKVHQSSLVDCLSASNDSHGFEVDDRARLDGCTSHYNLGTGIRAGDAVTITNCLVTNNTLQGIYVDNYCVLYRNQVRTNGGATYAGIWLSGLGNRCEDNQSSDNAYGVFTGGSDNLVFRNSCRDNAQGNYFTQNAGTNEVAPVITNPGANGYATMTPWSNIAY